MSSLGAFLLLATFVMASGAFAASLAGARRRQLSLIEGGIGLFHATTALTLVGSAVMTAVWRVGAKVGMGEEKKQATIKVGQIGVGHAHASKLGVFRQSADYEVVGIVEEDEQLKKQLATRPVTYLLGELDVLPLAGFDSSCPAMAQGPTRLARGQSFAAYVKAKYNAPHQVVVVPLCGHNARCMFTAEVALWVLFPKV